jgi:uncharacterized membrane protein
MQAILRTVHQHQGFTSAEISRIMGTGRHSLARRLANLERRGLIKSGRRPKWCTVCRCYCLSWWPVTR